MNCPHCGHLHTRVSDTKRVLEGLRRYRRCTKCHKPFGTLERIEEWDPTVNAYAVVDVPAAPQLQVVPPTPVEATAAKTPRRRGPAWQPNNDDSLLDYVTPAVKPLLLQWWNESRWSKHKGNATWTEAAWRASVTRVSNMPTDLQIKLCTAGVELGWQTLKLEYLVGTILPKSQTAANTSGRPLPQDPRMLEAIRQEHIATDAEPWPAA
jgi:hypothetical protein